MITSEMLEAAHFYGDYSMLFELLVECEVELLDQVEKSAVDVVL